MTRWFCQVSNIHDVRRSSKFLFEAEKRGYKWKYHTINQISKELFEEDQVIQNKIFCNAPAT